jgi:Fe-S-cluster containining protein
MTDSDVEQLLASDIVRGLVYTHNRANANTAQLHQASATLQTLVELLADKGLIDRKQLDTRGVAAAAQLRREFFERGMGVAMQEFDVSKYDFDGGVEIDCESRLPLCHAACCKLPLALSREDVREGVVRWDLGRPYMLARDRDRYCVHMERETCRCGVYDHRPIPCRGYDCRADTRIWLDFENRVINPAINEPDWPTQLMDEPEPTVEGA